MERKYLILLIIGLVVISAVLYGCANQKSTIEINGVLKEAIGKPSMYGQYYLETDNNKEIILEEGNKDLEQYINQNVLIEGYYKNQKLRCNPREQCGSENYKTFVITSIGDDLWALFRYCQYGNCSAGECMDDSDCIVVRVSDACCYHYISINKEFNSTYYEYASILEKKRERSEKEVYCEICVPPSEAEPKCVEGYCRAIEAS